MTDSATDQGAEEGDASPRRGWPPSASRDAARRRRSPVRHRRCAMRSL